MIKFTQLTEKLPYPPAKRAELSILHGDVITYVVEHYDGTNRYREAVASLMNTISYIVTNGDTLPPGWKSTDPFNNIEMIDSTVCEGSIGKLYIRSRSLSWDIQSVSSSDITEVVSKSEVPDSKVSYSEPSKAASSIMTPKSDLFIRPPEVPQFDYTKPYAQVKDGANLYTIYRTLPLIPQNQSQISVTTDIESMTLADRMKLFPNCTIRTRSPIMYEPYGKLTLDSELGVILPITGFSQKQVRDNIIKYPHLFKLMRVIDGSTVMFHTKIEIAGELQDTLKVWDTIGDSKKMPRNAEYIKEYVIRRYLLERDILKIEHNSKMYGELTPYLTLFTTPQQYYRYGCKDAAALVEQCIKARIAYKRSRNPICRRLELV